ncbi:MAG: tetratricopeptide repeat protein [Candidatus Omnitrophica bacterium]|nr:tetratricopeptide repeat protein [Candidatus Omnitrophota bacterium]
MDRAKQIVILMAMLVLAAFNGYCFDVTWEYESQVDEKLEKLQIYFETEMYQEASVLLQELIAQYPDEPRFSYLKAIVDYQRGDYEQAEDIFLQFTKEYPDVPEPHYLLSEISLSNGDAKKAQKHLKRYCALVPDDFQAQAKLTSLSAPKQPEKGSIIREGKQDPQLVKKLGFYGACVHSQEDESLKLVNGSFRTWSCMGMDFASPLDLRKKQIVLTLKGKEGGEKLELTFRDKFAKDYEPQLVIMREEGLLDDWQQVVIRPIEHQSKIDLSSVVHIGLEFGFSTVQNPAQSTLYVKDIVIENAGN